MILAGLQKNSFIDFPGKISCVLFTTGCNFTCPYCHNSDLARGEYPVRLESREIIDFLKTRQGMLEGVVITGGEPTLDKEIIDLCRAVKSLGYPLKLDTNGSRPGLLRRILAARLVDYVAMDIKAPLNNYHSFSRNPMIHEQLIRSIRTIMESAPAYEFRTTCAAPFVNATTVESIAKAIEGAECYVLQHFNRQAVCLDAAFNHRNNIAIPPHEMRRLKALATPFVERCIIR